MTDFNWNELFNRAKSVSFEPVPAGPYHVSIHEADAVAASTGKPMLKLKLNIEEGPHQNRKLLDQWVLSTDNETALSIFFRKCKAFGLDEAVFAQLPPGQLAPLAQLAIGRHAMATVGMREWQGEQRNEVKSYSTYKATGAPSVAGPVVHPGGFGGPSPQGFGGFGGPHVPNIGTPQTPSQPPAPSPTSVQSSTPIQASQPAPVTSQAPSQVAQSATESHAPATIQPNLPF